MHGSLVPGSQPTSKRCGLNFVDVWDVALCCRKNAYISCFQFFCSSTADRIAFISGLLKPSACAFLVASSLSLFYDEKPLCLANEANASELNGAPLSDLMTSGIPNIASMLSSTGMTVFADTERMISTIGYLEFSSTRTMSSPPDGKGPRKSILRCFHAACGISDICIGSRCGLPVYVVRALAGETVTYCRLHHVVHYREPHL